MNKTLNYDFKVNEIVDILELENILSKKIISEYFERTVELRPHPFFDYDSTYCDVYKCKKEISITIKY